jgi:hypothetical protein
MSARKPTDYERPEEADARMNMSPGSVGAHTPIPLRLLGTVGSTIDNQLCSSGSCRSGLHAFSPSVLPTSDGRTDGSRGADASVVDAPIVDAAVAHATEWSAVATERSTVVSERYSLSLSV